MNYLSSPTPFSYDELTERLYGDSHSEHFLCINSIVDRFKGTRLQCTISKTDKRKMTCSIQITGVLTGDEKCIVLGEHAEQHLGRMETVNICSLFPSIKG